MTRRVTPPVRLTDSELTVLTRYTLHHAETRISGETGLPRSRVKEILSRLCGYDILRAQAAVDAHHAAAPVLAAADCTRPAPPAAEEPAPAATPDPAAPTSAVDGPPATLPLLPDPPPGMAPGDVKSWVERVAVVLTAGLESGHPEVRDAAIEAGRSIDDALDRLQGIAPLLAKRAALTADLAAVNQQIDDATAGRARLTVVPPAADHQPPALAAVPAASPVSEAILARRWAHNSGVECSVRGQVPNRVIDAWIAAGRPGA